MAECEDWIARGLASRAQKAASAKKEDITIDTLFRLPRTGKVYTVKIPKFAANPTTVCTKMDDNTNLVCEPSTDTVLGHDDYEDIPLFRWYNCNYLRDEYGHAYPTAIEGIDNAYTTTGNVDVGVIQMSPYIKWDSSADDYTILSITDTPRGGYALWCEAQSNGETYPYVIHSKYIGGIGADGLLRSQPNLIPARNQSHNNLITSYAKKGAGYFGASEARNTWQIIFTLIKYAQKSSQKVFAGNTNYNYQYTASIQRTEKATYFPVTTAQAATLTIGSRVSVGYGSNNNGTVNVDRSQSTIHKYADSAKVLRIEPIDDTNSAVYLDITTGFDTISVALTDTLNAPITLTTMHWASGSTDAVIGRHDGSAASNTDSKHPYRVQGMEYAVGGYMVASDVVTDFQSDYSKNVLVAPAGKKHSSTDATIRSTYTNIGNITTGDWWIGDIELDIPTGVTYPAATGSGDSTGVGDRLYGGGQATNATREYLRGGSLWDGSDAGSSCLSCRNGLGSTYWNFLAAD